MKPKGEVFERIKTEPITGKKREVAKYILDNYVEASFLTAAELADRVQVSEPTVIRLAYDLGFKGYPKLKDALQEEVQAQLTTVEQLRRSRRRLSERCPTMQSLTTEMKNLDALIHSIDVRDVRRVVKALVAADKIIILGYKTSGILAQYLHTALKKSLDNTVAVTEAAGLFQEELVFASSQSVVVGISFPRYTEPVVRDFKQAQDHGVTTVAITDSELSPLVQHADHYLLASCRAVSFVDAFAAAMGLLCSIATEVSIANESSLMGRLPKLEKLWEENGLFF